jgi:hypothetical protein
VQLLIHHRRQPAVAVGGDGVHHLLQQRSGEPLGGVDVADLLAFRLGHRVDLGRLPSLLGLVVVTLGERGGIADRPHRDRLGDGRGKACRQQHRGRAAAGDHAQDDGEDVDQAVLATENPVGATSASKVSYSALAVGLGNRDPRHVASSWPGPSTAAGEHDLADVPAPTGRSTDLVCERLHSLVREWMA